MRCRCKVTFEFDIAAPLTWEGIVSAQGVQTIVSRAVVKAKEEFPNKSWSSMNVVVLEKLTDDLEDEAGVQLAGAATS